MKKYVFYLLVLLISLFVACGDDVDNSSKTESPKIMVDSELDLGFVSVRETTDKIIVLQNIGAGDLEIVDISLVEPGFSLSFPISEGFELTDRSNPKTIVKKDEKLFIRVKYQAASNAPVQAKLQIETNLLEPSIVNVIANSGPCLNILPNARKIVFGDIRVGETGERSLTIENCSPVSELRITDLKVCNLSGDTCVIEGAFSLKDLGPEALASDGVIKPGENKILSLDFDPIDGTSKGKVLFGSDDERYPEVEIALEGSGILETCPTAVASGRGGDPTFTQTQLNSTITIPVDLSASESLPFDSDIARYEWAIISRPVASNASLMSLTDENTHFIPDVIGDYVIELNVFDADNIESCMPSRFIVHAVGKEGIFIVLTWDIATDSDLDLHYLHPLGNWNRAPFDIFFNNRSADWGQTAHAADDPYLDDQNGNEVLSHAPSNDSHSYSVGVYSYGADGPTAATVQIFIDGQLEFEKKDKPLEARQFWYVSVISWPDKVISNIDRLDQNFP